MSDDEKWLERNGFTKRKISGLYSPPGYVRGYENFRIELSFEKRENMWCAVAYSKEFTKIERASKASEACAKVIAVLRDACNDIVARNVNALKDIETFSKGVLNG